MQSLHVLLLFQNFATEHNLKQWLILSHSNICLLYTSDTAAENMQTAESRIRDTDMAEEMVNYSKNDILAQANQSNQGVLSLLQ